MADIRSACDGKWGEQLIAVSVPDPSNLSHLKIIIISPESAPTGNYIFSLDVQFPYSYPFQPPKMMFLHQKIWHPKINTLGNICLYELYGGWSPAITMSALAMSIQDLLRHPGQFPEEFFNVLNMEAAKQFWANESSYRCQALEWAKEDNDGFGMVQFEDYRLKAIQSVLVVPNIINYECHLFCHTESKLRFVIVATIVPNLAIYRQKVEQDYRSVSQRLTFQEFQFQDDGIATIHSTKYSRDKCWEICIEDGAFRKAEIDLFDPRKESPPRCQITLTWLRPEKEPLTFTEKFQIKGGNNDLELRSFDVHVDPTCSGLSKSPASETSSQRPTLPLLLNLTLSSGQKINMAEVVGSNYFEFGVQLLNDETGKVVDAIEIEMQKVPKNITRKILNAVAGREGKGDYLGGVVGCA